MFFEDFSNIYLLQKREIITSIMPDVVWFEEIKS